jgi:hypothetical protein
MSSDIPQHIVDKVVQALYQSVNFMKEGVAARAAVEARDEALSAYEYYVSGARQEQPICVICGDRHSTLATAAYHKDLIDRLRGLKNLETLLTKHGVAVAGWNPDET